MHFNQAFLGVLSLVVALFQTGCFVDVDSDDVRTSGYFADYAAYAYGDGDTLVQARLRVGGGSSNTFAELDGDDRLLASKNRDIQIMAKRRSGAGAPYEAVMQGDEEGAMRIAFERGDQDLDASDSEVILPPPFSLRLVGFQERDEVPRDSDVTVEWENNDSGQIGWEIDGICIRDRTGVTSDTGSHTFLSREIQSLSSEEENDSCEVSLRFTRTNEGYVDPAFREGGTFQAVQSRTIRIFSIPADGSSIGAAGASGN